jgi:hypothetical protein
MALQLPWDKIYTENTVKQAINDMGASRRLQAIPTENNPLRNAIDYCPAAGI